MKKLLKTSLAFMLCFAVLIMVACGEPATTVTLGTYSEANNTFTATTSTANYTLEKNGTSLVLKGTIPYSTETLGVNAGNIVAIKFTPGTEMTPDDETSIKTTNRQDASANGWNVYDKDALEDDGSLIWVTNVSKTQNVQIKIKWNANTAETTYTLTVDDSATLATA